MTWRRFLLTLFIGTATLAIGAPAGFSTRAEVRSFIDEMVQQHGFVRADLEDLFGKTQPRPDIIEAMTRPAEAKPWHAYRPIFLTPDRVREGAAFWAEHEKALREAQRRFGVDPQIIVAILGVETRYGRFTGRHRVMDALSTLAFDYPPRAPFFRKELEQYLLMTREEAIAPLSLTGSYAGAMGTPQFIPSSFRNFAVDFDGDGHRDLWRNTGDIIGSVANYFSRHGWREGAAVAIPADVTGTHHQPLLQAGLKPHLPARELSRYGVTPHQALADTDTVALLQLESAEGPEHWVTLDNFYVITRYNRSPLYAMAVYQLSEEIRQTRQRDKALFIVNETY